MSSENLSFFRHSLKIPPQKLKPITKLLQESYKIFCSKIRVLLGIIIFPVGFSFFCRLLMGFLASSSFKYSIWFSIMGAISFVGSFFVWSWAVPSLIYALKDNTNIKESYKRGLKILPAYIWVYFLLTTIITGGFLLFVIPGILFSVWFSLAIFVLVFEKKRGFNALLKSQHLVKGKFWAVFWRFLILGLIVGLGVILISTLIFLIIENQQIENQISELIGYFFQLFILPFFLIYGFLIYENLREIKAESLYVQPSIWRKIKYIFPAILGTLIFGLIITFSFLNIFLGRDIPPIDDSDLWLSKIEIPKSENAFYYLSQAREEMYLPKEKEKRKFFQEMVKGKNWDIDFAKELIEKNEKVFDYFEKAITLSYFQFPQLQNPRTIDERTYLPGMEEFRYIAQLNSIKANYLLSQDKEEEALDLIFKTIKMGQMIEDSPRPLLINYLFGMAIKEIGLERLRMTIPKLTLSPDKLKNYIAEIEKFKENEEGLIRAMKMEYILLTNTKSKIDKIFFGELSKEELKKLDMEDVYFEIKGTTYFNYLYKPNQTQKIFAQYYRNFIDNAKKDCNEIKVVKIKPLAPHSKIKMLFTENVIGKVFHDISMANLSGILEKKCLEDFSINGTQLLMAIRAYQIETGKLPSSLKDLTPKYLSEIPKDPFNGKLKYLPDKKIIYSVGKNLKDEGGSDKGSWRTMSDPTFKIEF